MANEPIDKIEKKDEAISVHSIILSTAITTAFRLFVTGVLVFVLFLGAFPLRAMFFFDKLGLDDRALDMAKVYTNREKKEDNLPFSGFANGLTHQMTLSERLYLRTKNNKYLKDIYSSTFRYLSIENIDQRNEQIDKQNLEIFPIYMHANVFSYQDRICNLNYFAAVRLQKQHEFFLGRRFLNIDQIISELREIEENDIMLNFIYNNNKPIMALDFAIFFGQISTYAQYNLEEIEKGSTAFIEYEFIELFELLAEKIVFFKDFALSYLDNFDPLEKEKYKYAYQTQLYMVRSLGLMMENLYEYFFKIDNNSEVWDTLRQTVISIENSDESGLIEITLTIIEYYYNILLPKYISFNNNLTLIQYQSNQLK